MKIQEVTDHVLVSFSADWADECTFQGFRVMKFEEWQAQTSIYPPAANIHVGYGSNEDDEMTGKEFLRCFTVTFLTPDQVQFMKDLFGLKTAKDHYGKCPLVTKDEYDGKVHYNAW